MIPWFCGVRVIANLRYRTAGLNIYLEYLRYRTVDIIAYIANLRYSCDMPKKLRYRHLRTTTWVVCLI